jgi:hypothetical protein
MYKELRHQVKIHRISEKLNKGIKICIFQHISTFFFYLKKKVKHANNEKKKKIESKLVGKDKPDLRERGLTIPR